MLLMMVIWLLLLSFVARLCVAPVSNEILAIIIIIITVVVVGTVGRIIRR